MKGLNFEPTIAYPRQNLKNGKYKLRVYRTKIMRTYVPNFQYRSKTKGHIYIYIVGSLVIVWEFSLDLS
jgi:ribosomal protein L10